MFGSKAMYPLVGQPLEDPAVSKWEATVWMERHERVDRVVGSDLLRAEQTVVFQYHVRPGVNPHEEALEIAKQHYGYSSGGSWRILAAEAVLVRNEAT